MHPTLRYSLIYGGLAAVVLAVFIAVIGLLHDRVAWVGTMTFGFSVMLVAMSFIFVGVKRYRDVEHGGVIKFAPALGMGLAIAGVAALAYIVVWEIYLASTGYRFMDDYVAGILRAREAAGASATELAREAASMESMRMSYGNPLYRVPMTFLEIFPVGLLVALFSAFLLRNPKLLPATR